MSAKNVPYTIIIIMKSQKMPELSFGLRRKFHDGVIWPHWGLNGNFDKAVWPQCACLAPSVQLVIAGVPVCIPTGLGHAWGRGCVTTSLLHLNSAASGMCKSSVNSWWMNRVQQEASSLLLPSGQLWGSCWEVRARTEGAHRPHPHNLSIRMLLVPGCEE